MLYQILEAEYTANLTLIQPISKKEQKKKAERPAHTPNAEKQSAKLEREIARLEEKLAALDREAEENAADYQKLLEIEARKETLNTELLSLYEKWEEVNA